MAIEEQILVNTEEILTILKDEFNIVEEPTEPTITTSFQEELQQQLQTSSAEDVIEWIITRLENEELYSEEDMILKIFADIKKDTILEIKIKPYNKWGLLIHYFQENLGEPDFFETSKYTMRVILAYNLTKYIQYETEPGEDIVDQVNEEWNELNG